MTTSARPRIDYTQRDYTALRDAMLELARERLPEWTDHSPNDLGVLLVELFASMGDALFYHQDRIANESYLETAREPRSVIHLLRLIGYELRPPVPASAQLSLAFAKDATGTITVTTGAEFRTPKELTGTPIHFRYQRSQFTIDLDAIAPSAFMGGTFKVYGSLPVVQVDATVTGEIVASSDGSANQRYALARPGLIEDTLVLTVTEGQTSRVWQRQKSLLRSGASDEHYVLHRDENDVTWIEFGDGQYGKRPARGRNNIQAAYQVGGGSRGNVPPNSINTPVAGILKGGTLQEVKPAKVGNPEAASGGADRESLEEAIRRGPRLFRAQGRAVTASDYEAHARSLGVAKARATMKGPRIELFVAPSGGGRPSDTLKDDLRLHFEDKRIVTTLVEIRDPTYIEVVIEGQVTVEPFSYQREVGQRAMEALRTLWSFDAVDFGDVLYVSKIYEAIEAIEGVAGVVITRFARLDAPAGSPAVPLDGKLTFGGNEIPLCTGFTQLGLTGGRSDG